MFKVKDIAKILDLKFKPTFGEDLIEYLLYDSRQIISADQSIFFAFKTKSNDGHKYIVDLIEKGVKYFVISDDSFSKKYTQQQFFLVQDVKKALQEIATAHRKKFDIPIIGITGSNGKTIVKEWLSQMLESKFELVKNPKSFNSQIGVPISVSRINSKHDLGIFEAGISTTGEMQNLEKILKPSIGIFTNIGSAHAAGFDDLSEKIKEKINLFKNCKTIIYCRDHAQIALALKEMEARKICWSKSGEADLEILSEERKESNTLLKLKYKDEIHPLELPVADEASIENLMHGILTALHLGVELPYIQDQLNQLEKIEMRLELLEAENNSLLINDSYNADLESLTAALQFMAVQQRLIQNVVILSDFLQIQEDKTAFYKKVGEIICRFDIDLIYAVGKDIIELDQFLSKDVKRYFFSNTIDLKSHLNKNKLISSLILLKGARRFKFERLANQLIKKQHQAVLEINLTAASQNYDHFKNLLEEETKILCMVKASGYGSGGVEMARLLSNKNVDYLGVAYIDEGISLRNAGIDTPILVLNVDPSGFKKMVENNLEPEIYSLKQLKRLQAFLSLDQSIDIHLKLDSGMHRLGFEDKDIETLTEILACDKRMKVKSIFSHLAASEDEDQDAFSHQQVSTFESLFDKISKRISQTPFKHILNSAGILRFPQYQYEMVRLGIGLYGVEPVINEKTVLLSVMKLKANISQIKQLEAGDSIGYGRSGMAKGAMRIAIINIGYADGLLRKAGNGNYSVLINGHLAPTIGNICMDMSMIDISKISNVEEGDEVIIFGDKLPVHHLSKVLDTIPYEVFTNISNRVKRVYYQE